MCGQYIGHLGFSDPKFGEECSVESAKPGVMNLVKVDGDRPGELANYSDLFPPVGHPKWW